MCSFSTVLYNEISYILNKNVKRRVKMANLYFRYGAMGSSKTANALMARYNFLEKGKSVALVKPDVENRDGKSKIKSRIGLEANCLLWSEFKTIYDSGSVAEYDAVIVDEVQFLEEEDIDVLADIVDFYHVPVLCYGLRTDFTSHLFNGSKRLMEVADVIEEIRTICWCGKRACVNARLDKDGNIMKKGNQIMMGDSEYESLCRKHYKTGETKVKKKKHHIL